MISLAIGTRFTRARRRIDISFGRAAPGFALPEGPAKGVDWAKEKSTTPFS